MFFKRGGSDLFDFATERFTLDREDFRGLAGGLEAGGWIGDRVELTLSLDGARWTRDSEYRDWVEPVEGPGGSVVEVPILQTIRFSQGPAAALGLRVYFLPRVDRLSEFVWIPRAWNAFVGGGGGFTAYRLVLEGDFVDEVNETISAERFVSSGNTPFPYLAGGLEVGVTTRTAAVLEGRYQWGSAVLGPDFADFSNPLDLSGARLSLGLQYRF
jgi:hypothetical protein